VHLVKATLKTGSVYSAQVCQSSGGGGEKIKIKNIHLLNERCFKCFEMDYQIKYENVQKIFIFFK
jgi:hypothetical protein